MNKLISIASDTWRGLIQRRLWPVAALLLAALVAVPLVLTADPEPVPATPPGQAADEAAELAAQPLVAVASAAERESRRRVLGARKDPFKPTNQPNADKRKRDGNSETRRDSADRPAQSSTAAGGTATSGSSPSSSSSPATGGGTYVAPAPTDSAAERPSRPAGSLTVRWGVAGDGDLETLDVERLDPLPTSDEPLLVYLGLTRDGRSAVFMLDAGITVDGDGRCRPDPEDCQTVELAPGETEFIEVTGEDGAKTQYQLDLVKIHGRRAAATRTLGKRAAVEARAARRALRSLGHVAPSWRFDARTGTFERAEAGDS